MQQYLIEGCKLEVLHYILVEFNRIHKIFKTKC